MIEINFNDYYLVNSNKEVFLFRKTVDENVESPSMNFITDETIYLYSATIDSNDKIYILVLSKSGELHLYTNSNMSWTKYTIAKFDFVSNIYKQLEIKIVNEKVNIFYSFYNTSFSNIWMIQHLTFKTIVEERHTVVRYAAINRTSPFILDIDSNGNIHMIYNNNSQVYYTLYNPYTKKWNTPVKQLSKKEYINTSPYLFVDIKDNLHCLWLNKYKEKNQLNYMRMPIKGKDSFIWKTMKFPFQVFTDILPIIFQENDVLKLIYYDKDCIKFIYSSDSGTTWKQGDKTIDLESLDSIINSPSNLLDGSKANHLIKGISEILKIETLDYQEVDVINELVLEAEYEEELEVIIRDSDNIEINEYKETIQLILENQNQLRELLQESIEREVFFREELIQAVKDIEIKNGFFHKLFRSTNN